MPGSFTTIDAVVNRGAIVEVAENEPLTESKLAPLGSGGGLPPTIPQGMRAISVRTNEVVGVAGFVIPGTRVDVLVTVKKDTQDEPISRAVVSNVEVLTAGTRFDQEKAKADGKPIPTTVVTLLVTPDQARAHLARGQRRADRADAAQSARCRRHDDHRREDGEPAGDARAAGRAHARRGTTRRARRRLRPRPRRRPRRRFTPSRPSARPSGPRRQ